jgi:GNAT superfamily N-acetyltransferase
MASVHELKNGPLDDQPNKPPRDYTVRRFRPEDAAGVAACFRETYGESYPLAACYDPRRLIEQNRTGRHLAAVAVAGRTGEVVGHCSVQCRFPWPVGECGQIMVRRGHQGRSLAVRMGQFLEQEALSIGLRCLVTYEVTSHQATQLIVHLARFRPCGLLLGAMPATLDFRTMTGAVSQRESCMTSFKYLVPPQPAAVRVPAHHQDMIARIFAGLEKTVVFQPPSPISGLGEIIIRESQTWETAEILVPRIGENTPQEIRAHLRELLARDIAEVIYLEIPLDQAGGETICQEAEKVGFFFAGLGPSSTSEGEALILQYLNTKLELSCLRVATPMGKEILEYLRQEQRRVGG